MMRNFSVMEGPTEKHVSMMHACVMHVKNGDERTDQPPNEQGDSRSRMMRKSMMLILFVTDQRTNQQ